MATNTMRVENDSALAEIHNVIEKLVIQEIRHLLPEYPAQTEDYWADVACLALNQLPARYIRYDVDYAFHQQSAERHRLESQVRAAIGHARDIVVRRSGLRD